jgi:hypothetical protein
VIFVLFDVTRNMQTTYPKILQSMGITMVPILYPRTSACKHSPQQEGLLKSVLLKSDAGDTLLPSHPGPASPAFHASFNEQIKHIIRKLHAVSVQPQQQQDESLCGMLEHQMIFARPIDQIPDFDRPVPVPIPILSPGPDLVARSRHDLGPVRGKRH